MDWSIPKSLFAALVLPPAGPLLLAALGCWLWARGGRARRGAGRTLVVVGLAAGWILATPVVAEALIGWVEAAAPAPLTDEALARELKGAAPPGAIVVIAGGVRHNEREWPEPDWPNALTLERLAFAARLARTSGLPILVSGGTPPDRDAAEAELMARSLRASFGLSPRWVEGKSRDTAGNAAESARLLAADGIRRVVLVTQAYHMPRALASFRAAGLEAIAAPHGHAGGLNVEQWQAFVPGAGATMLTRLAVHEALGAVWYRLRGHL